jgi:hypothetical protein
MEPANRVALIRNERHYSQPPCGPLSKKLLSGRVAAESPDAGPGLRQAARDPLYGHWSSASTSNRRTGTSGRRPVGPFETSRLCTGWHRPVSSARRPGGPWMDRPHSGTPAEHQPTTAVAPRPPRTPTGAA